MKTTGIIGILPLEPISRWIKACGMSRSSFRIPLDFDGGEHVYRVHPINVQLVTDPVIISSKEEHRCDSGSERLDKHE